MTRTFKAAAATVGALAVVAVSGATAFAATTPPWQPGTSANGDTNNVGTLKFFNARGQQIVSGSTTAPIAAYIEAANLPFLTGTRGKVNNSADMYYATPKSGTNPGLWNTQSTSGVTQDPVTTAPAPINTYSGPTVATTSSDPSIDTYVANNPDSDNAADSSGNPTDTTGYDNVYEVRVFDTGTVGQDTNYASADIQVNPVAHTWQEVYPDTTVTTTPPASLPETPYVPLLALSAVAVGGMTIAVRRRKPTV